MGSFGYKYAEHNIGCDVDAAAIVFEHLNSTVVDFNLSLVKALLFEQLNEINS